MLEQISPVSKEIRICFGLVWLCLVIGLKISHQFVIQSQGNPKPFASRSYTFSRAWPVRVTCIYDELSFVHWFFSALCDQQSIFFSLILWHWLKKALFDESLIYTAVCSSTSVMWDVFYCFIRRKKKTVKTVFNHISKHREGSWKYDPSRSSFHELCGVWKCGQALSQPSADKYMKDH